MLTTIKNWLRDRRDRQELLNLRAMMMQIQMLLFPENDVTGTLARMKTGLRLEQHLENRLGLMGPDFFDPVTSDCDLERVGKILERLPPQQLDQRAAELERLCKRTLFELGEPEEWKDGEDTKNAATIIALRLLSGWLTSKSIIHTSMNRAVVKEAQEADDLYHFHIRGLLRLFRGEKA